MLRSSLAFAIALVVIASGSARAQTATATPAPAPTTATAASDGTSADSDDPDLEYLAHAIGLRPDQKSAVRKFVRDAESDYQAAIDKYWEKVPDATSKITKAAEDIMKRFRERVTSILDEKQRVVYAKFLRDQDDQQRRDEEEAPGPLGRPGQGDADGDRDAGALDRDRQSEVREVAGRAAVEFVLAFIPLFVAIDVVGVLPVYASLTQALSREERLQVARDACLTALGVAVGFMFLGEAVFETLGVTTGDFRIAGGLLLLVFAIQDLVIGGKPRRTKSAGLVGVVPLGIPLITGPAVLTTTLLIARQHGQGWTLLALVANLLIVLIVLRGSDRIMRVVGAGGAVAAGKIASLFLATIGVMMIRVGVQSVLKPAG